MNSLLFRSTRMNRVAGQSLYLKDLNCHCFDPTRDLTLNPAAWQDVPASEWGYSAAYYNDYRFARRPDEQFSLGRSFAIREDMAFSVRGEVFNAFNRLVLPNPSSGNPFRDQNQRCARQSDQWLRLHQRNQFRNAEKRTGGLPLAILTRAAGSGAGNCLRTRCFTCSLPELIQ
ncbi:MAG: hypothetical protein ABI759_10670 [Candidatus Solibacter sp.]